MMEIWHLKKIHCDSEYLTTGTENNIDTYNIDNGISELFNLPTNLMRKKGQWEGLKPYSTNLFSGVDRNTYPQHYIHYITSR